MVGISSPVLHPEGGAGDGPRASHSTTDTNLPGGMDEPEEGGEQEDSNRRSGQLACHIVHGLSQYMHSSVTLSILCVFEWDFTLIVFFFNNKILQKEKIL